MNTTPSHTTPTPASAPDEAGPALDTVSLTALRAPAVRHLLALRAERRLTRAHVRTTAQCLNVSDRTVWRWLAEATTTPATAAPGARHSDRFEITPELRVLLAYWHGNASAVHRELLARARQAPTPATSATPPTPPADTDASASGPATHPSSPPRSVLPGGAPLAAVPLLDPVPSLATFLRAVRRDLTAGRGPATATATRPPAPTMCSPHARGCGATRCGRPTTSRPRSAWTPTALSSTPS